MNVAVCLLPLVTLVGCGYSLNSPIAVPSGARSAHEVKSINGEVRIGERSLARGVKTVNGAIKVARGCTIEGDLASVNGAVTVAENSRINGCVRTVNGRITLEMVQVDQDISTYNGEIRLAGVQVGGDIVIQKLDHGGEGSHGTPVLICLSEGTEIQGKVKVEEEGRQVIVRMGAGCSVRGGLGRARLLPL